MAESQNIEWKRSWKDKYLEWVCGFSNAQGATLFIGKDDAGSVHGLANSKRLLEEIPQKIRNLLGLTIDVNLHETGQGDFLEIVVPAQSVPVSYRGHYYYRSGSTKSELSGASLNEFLLKKSGRTWDASIEDRATLDDIDPAGIQRFLKDAEQTGRLPDTRDLAPVDLLKKLRLASGDQLTCAALVLFGKDPAEFYPGISVRIGRFGSNDADLQFQEVVEGNLIYCLREALNQILGKFTIKPITFEGIQRIESPQYPIEALREILLNAMVHRRYQSGVHVQIRVYADRIICWNEGPLPQELTIEKLLGFHSSYPRNPLIADACFKAGYIDSWGRGIEKITGACHAADLPEPAFEEAEGGMRVTLFAAREGLESRLESRPESRSEGASGTSEGATKPEAGVSESKKDKSDTERPESGVESLSEGANELSEGAKDLSEGAEVTLDQQNALAVVFHSDGILPRTDALKTRYKVLQHLVSTPEIHAADLAKLVGVSQSTIERHLAALKGVELINIVGNGNSRVYRPTTTTEEFIRQWGGLSK